MTDEEMDKKIKELLENDNARTWKEFCFNCHNTEEVACEFCEYEGKGEPSEYQTFQDSLDYLTINWENE